MSYEIIYDRAAVKVDDNKYLILLIGGSNNCYDILPNGRERRERNWLSNYIVDYYLKTEYAILTKEEISQNIDKALYEVIEKVKADKDYKDRNLSSAECQDIANKRFSYYSCITLKSSNTTFQKVKNFIMNAVNKYAATPEEYAKANHPLIYKFYHYDYHNGSGYIEDEKGTLSNSVDIKNVISQRQARHDKYKQILNIQVKHVYVEADMVHLRKCMFPELYRQENIQDKKH